MGYYKRIRRSLKGLNVHPQTRGWILKMRRQEMDLETSLAGWIKWARKEGRCTALIMTAPGRLCGEPSFRRGYCTRHHITHVLHLPDRKAGQMGKGVSARPFTAYEFPIGRLSAVQEDLMADLSRLPMATSKDECLQRLNAEDPSNTLAPLNRERLNSKKRRK